MTTTIRAFLFALCISAVLLPLAYAGDLPCDVVLKDWAPDLILSCDCDETECPNDSITYVYGCRTTSLTDCDECTACAELEDTDNMEVYIEYQCGFKSGTTCEDNFDCEHTGYEIISAPIPLCDCEAV